MIEKDQVYRHYKGNFYKVLCVTQPARSGSYASERIVIRESDLEPLKLYCNGDYCWLETFEHDVIEFPMVVYSNTQKPERPWARLVESFNERTADNLPRFTLVDQESASY